MNIINSILIIFIMMGAGALLANKDILNEKTNSLFSKLLVNLCLPSAVLTAFAARFTRKDLIESVYKLFLCYIIIVLMCLVGQILIRVFKISEKRKSTLVNMVMFSNTLFIGLPVNTTLFGEEATPYLFIYWFASFSTFWTIGILNFTWGNEKFSLTNSLKKLLTPPLIALAIALILVYFNIHLPTAIYEPLKKFGAMTTPMAMLFLGTVIHKSDLRSFKFNRDVFLVIIGRFVFAPIIATTAIAIASQFIGMDVLSKKVFIITASLPIMANLAIVSKQYEKDYEFTSLMIGLTTVLSIISLPIHAFLLEIIF